MSSIIIFFAVLYSSIKKWYPEQNLCNWLQTSLGKWMSWFLTFSINVSVIIIITVTVVICCGAQIEMCCWYCVQTCLFSCTSSTSRHNRKEYFRDHVVTFRMRMLKFSICAEASLGRIKTFHIHQVTNLHITYCRQAVGIVLVFPAPVQIKKNHILDSLETNVLHNTTKHM